jgi:hypothetical protein
LHDDSDFSVVVFLLFFFFLFFRTGDQPAVVIDMVAVPVVILPSVVRLLRGLRLPGRRYKAASAAIRSGMAPACM